MSPSGSGFDTKSLWLITISVGVWWAANSITAISSKNVMKDAVKSDSRSWSAAFLDFRWFELTALQHLLGAVVSVLWLKVVLRKPVWPAEASKQIISMAALGNVVGNMATNAAYAMVSSSMTQVVKACEPLFMFGLSVLLYRDYKVINATTLLSIVIMVAGASLFVAFDSTFIVSGLLAALCSDIAFPIRNIYLKKLSTVWESSFQKYAVISLYSTLLLAPVMLIKLSIYQSFALANKLNEGIISSSLHCTYNLASIYVLQHFSPLSHAILNLLKRGIVIVVNLIYFQLPLSWRMIIGLIAVLAGLYCYLNKSLRGDRFSPPKAILVISVVVLCSLFFIPIGTETSFSRASPQKVAVSLNHLNRGNDANAVMLPTDTSLQQSVGKYNPDLNFKNSTVRTAWVFDRPVPSNVLTNLQTLSKHTPVHVYCGTSHCVQAVNNISSTDITAEFLLIGELVKDTPFQKWLRLQNFYKVLTGTLYEDHLQEVVRLGILWKYGGRYIEPNVAFTGEIPDCLSRSWVGQSSMLNSLNEPFNVACFSKYHRYIEKLSNLLVQNYYKKSSDYSLVPTFNISKEAWNSSFHSFPKSDLPKHSEFNFSIFSTENDQPWNHHYGTLIFVTRVSDISSANLGDEIQSYPGLQFLPFMDNFLDRDNLIANKNKDHDIIAFMNAWWGSGTIRTWPPPPNIDPILVSMHVGDDMKKIWAKSVNYLQMKGPIGCRDFTSVDFLTKLGVPNYFSGCLTLMLRSPYSESERTDEVYINDVSREYVDMLPREIRNKAIWTRHHLVPGLLGTNLGRFTEAFEILKGYARAKLVITQRIHTALPCVAMGTPVIFINSPGLPGGGGSKTTSCSRTVGLTSMFHTLDVYEMPKEKIPEWLTNFPWDNIPPNPDMVTVMRLRASFWDVIRRKPSLYDASRKFGLIPMTPPGPCANHVLFHAVFASPDSKFTWQNHRSIESIFRHHPCATVLVHSNTLNIHRFDVLKESGYLIDVARYDIGTLVPEMKDLPSANDDSFVLRSLILYKWGGIYMDMTIILVQPLTKLPSSLLVWGDSSKDLFDTFFMIFEKNSKYLRSVLTKSAQDLVSVDNGLFTQVWKENTDFDIETRDSDSFFVFDKDNIVSQCYESTSGPKFEANKKVIKEKAFGVSLPQSYTTTQSISVSAKKSGTLCKGLLNDFCVLCNDIY